MWNCKHEPWCKEPGKITVVRELITIETLAGKVLETDITGDVIKADCHNCHAPAEWED